MLVNLSPKEITNPDKIFFPEENITKYDVVAYYKRIAPYMLPFLKNRPLTQLRYPNGITGESFYQKEVGSYYPEWIDRILIHNQDGTTTTYVVCQNRKTLVYLANQACLTPHIWLSKRDKLDYPDKVIFDLDPGEKTTFDTVKKTALLFKKILEQHKIISFPMTTGSRGIHVVIPIKRELNFDKIRAKAHKLAQEVAASWPEELTVNIRKEERKGRLFIDWLRNSFGQTSVAPYAIRAVPTAAVATPVTWDEVAGKKLQARTYTIKNIHKRVEEMGDVWTGYNRVKNSFKKL